MKALGIALVAAAIGAALACSVVVEPIPALAFPFMGLLILCLQRARSWRHSVCIGWAAGAGCNAVAFYWIVGLLQAFAGFPLIAALPVAALLWMAQGLTMAAAVALGESLARARVAPRWVTTPLGFVVAFGAAPSLFPWNPSASLVEWTAYAQIAELGGAPLLDAALLFGSAAAFEVMHSAEAMRNKRLSAAALVMVVGLGVPPVYGWAREGALAEERAQAPRLQVGVVQPNVGIWEKRDRALAPQHLQQLRAATAELERAGAEVVLWPETAYPYPLARARTHEPEAHYAMRNPGSRVAVLVGAITQGGECERWNSVIAVGPDGDFEGVADKVALLHFGETVPLWHVLPPLQKMFRCPGLTAGERPMRLPVQIARPGRGQTPATHSTTASVGVLNCYEDVLARATRAVARQNPGWLANFTNDAWFGDTAEPHLHQLIARLRSIETRRELVRAVNTGVSSHIAIDGRVFWETDTFVAERRLAEVGLYQGLTPYVRLGDWVTSLAMGALAALLLLAWLTTRSSINGRGSAGRAA